MRAINFNENWYVAPLGADEKMAVTLPHDAMLGEKRSSDSPCGVNNGWIVCGDWVYTKTFEIKKEYVDKKITFGFEGVYRNAEVYINGKKAIYRPYGYTDFYVEADEFLKYGEQNEITVIAKNSDQPNSRWYSGTGIYRPVTMYVADKKHILLRGIKIRTLQINPAKVELEILTSHSGEVEIEITREGEKIKSFTLQSDGKAATVFEVENALLWDTQSPNLYQLRAKFFDDVAEENFGIRTTSCDSKNGFCLNGKRVIIRGACLHHDNGILGARCYREAEERKVRLMKENGYNAIRSAHNPCSRAMLDACDRLGVLMMDEYVDMWYIHKTMYDYADYVLEWYERDIEDMIRKDFNHPSVIMYSLGNEVAETGQEKGIEFFKKMRDVCKRLDPDRQVTVGVNIFFNYLHALGFGVYSDKKAKENPQKKVGSEFFNTLAGIMGDGFMKTMAKLPGCDKKTRGAFAAMDVAGYNYGIKRYKGDMKKYPDRIILGSETFCADAYAFWEIAKKHRAIIGDYVWAGMDYLGEVGIGTREYRDYAPDFLHGLGWVSAGSGRLDLTGKPLAEAAYTRVAFELEEKPQIAVIPVNHTFDKHSPSCWKFTNAIESWSWNGLDGKKAKVEVYARAEYVDLEINGKKVGRKKFKKNCRFTFKTRYYGGKITAIALDKNKNELSRNSLLTAKDDTKLSIEPEKSGIRKGDIAFVRLRFTDESGILKPLCRGEIKVEITGGELLALGNGCPFNLNGYLGDTTDTYYGEALLVMRADSQNVKITASCGELKSEKVL